MKITLERLEWNNWFSYGENNYINFDDYPLIQIKGENGVGKSCVPLILEETLYGKNSKGIKKQDLLNRYSTNSTISSTLYFSVGEDQYTVVLSRKATIKLNLYKNDEDISAHTASDTYKLIEDILKVDFKTFSQLTYQSATSSLEFLTATDTQRKKFLITLFNLDIYTELFEIFKDAFKEIQKIYSNVEGKINVISKWVDEHEKTDKNVRAKLELITAPDLEIKDLSLLEDKLSNINNINSKINSNNHYRNQMALIDKSQLGKEVEKPDLTEINTKVVELKATINRLNNELKRYSNLSNICPACKQPIDISTEEALIAEKKLELSQTTEALKIATAEQGQLQIQEKLYNDHNKAIKEFERLINLIDDTIQEVTLDASEIQRSIAGLKAIIEDKKKKLTNIINHNNEVEKHNSRIKLILEQLEKYKTDLLLEQEELSNISTKLTTLEILKDSFSTNGLISYKLESLVKALENQINIYLIELSYGRFQLNFAINGDKLDIQIIDNGSTITIDSLSSGEKARVNIATLLAIRNLMTNISSTKINILFLDEILGVVDLEGKTKLVEILLKEDLNTFIVSHEFSHPLMPCLYITKENNISRIENGGQ